MVIDRRLPIEKFNGLWTLQQYRAGLVGRSKKAGGIRISKEQIESAYQDGTVQRFFNPLDVKPVRKADKLAGYLTKYITKNKDSFRCRAWHCSREVSNITTSMVVPREMFDLAACVHTNPKVDIKTGEVTEPAVFSNDYVGMVSIHDKEYFYEFLEDLRTINKWVMSGEYVIKREDLQIETASYKKYILREEDDELPDFAFDGNLFDTKKQLTGLEVKKYIERAIEDPEDLPF